MTHDQRHMRRELTIDWLISLMREAQEGAQEAQMTSAGQSIPAPPQRATVQRTRKIGVWRGGC